MLTFSFNANAGAFTFAAASSARSTARRAENAIKETQEEVKDLKKDVQELKEKVEEHLKNCPTCRAKLEIISSLLKDLKESVENEQEEVLSTTQNSQYRLFQNNLSAYVDNELPPEENIKIKKFTINNKIARKELENTYSIRKLMNDSFQKTKSESRQDFSKNVMKQLDMSSEASLGFHPLLKVAIAFVLTVLLLSAIIVFSLTL